MRKLFFVLMAFSAASLLYCCKGTNSPDGLNLKFNLQKGEKFLYTAGMDMHSRQNVMGKDMDVNTRMDMAYTFDVTGDSAGWKQVNATISKIAINMDAGGMQIKFDSDDPAAADSTNPMAKVGKIFGAMKGGQFGFTMNEKGKVGNVTGIREMMEHAVASLNDPTASAALMSGLSKTFDENQFKQNLEQSFGIYPDKPVKAGDSWNKTMTMNNAGILMKMDNTYTLESVDNNNSNVKMSSKISSGSDSAKLMGMNMDMNGTMEGTMQFDIASGMPVKGVSTMQMNMKVKSQGTEMPMNMTFTMNITGKKL
ncbi:MAG: DUF6263 family protein [Chitinophagaceae bacterium]